MLLHFYALPCKPDHSTSGPLLAEVGFVTFFDSDRFFRRICIARNVDFKCQQKWQNGMQQKTRVACPGSFLVREAARAEGLRCRDASTLDKLQYSAFDGTKIGGGSLWWNGYKKHLQCKKKWCCHSMLVHLVMVGCYPTSSSYAKPSWPISYLAKTQGASDENKLHHVELPKYVDLIMTTQNPKEKDTKDSMNLCTPLPFLARQMFWREKAICRATWAESSEFSGAGRRNFEVVDDWTGCQQMWSEMAGRSFVSFVVDILG